MTLLKKFAVSLRGKGMAWRLHDYIHLHLTDFTVSDLQTEGNSLGLIDKLLNEDNRFDSWITFSPQYREVFDIFNDLVRKDFRYVTTFGQVRDFVELCFSRYYEKSNDLLDLDEMLAQVCEEDLPEDTIILIEFED